MQRPPTVFGYTSGKVCNNNSKIYSSNCHDTLELVVPHLLNICIAELGWNREFSAEIGHSCVKLVVQFYIAIHRGTKLG